MNRLGEEKISKLLMQFSIPAIIGMLVNALYNVVDRIFIGNIPDIGGLALTGVGVTMPITGIIMALALLVGVGTSARISLKLGEHKQDEAEKHLGNAVSLLVIISVLITVFGLIFMKPLLSMFGASLETEIYAAQYMKIVYIGTIFNLLGFGLTHSIRSDGSPKVAMCSMLLGAGTNIILDPIFIFGFGLGVQGAALATVLSQVASMVLVLYYFTKGKSNLKILRRNLKLESSIVLSIFSIGMSSFAMQVAQSLVLIIANNELKKYGGDLAIGAMTIVISISMIFLMPVYGLNQGSQPVIGYNYGAKKYKRVKEAITIPVIVGTIIVIVGWALIELKPELIIRVFSSDESLLDMSIMGTRWYLFMLPVLGFQIISASYFQGIGKAKISMFLSLLRQVILLIPCLILLPRVGGLGLMGVWLAGPVADGLASIVTGIVFFREIQKLKQEQTADGVEEKVSLPQEKPLKA